MGSGTPGSGRWLATAPAGGRIVSRYAGWPVHRLLITGSRKWSDVAMLRAALDERLAELKVDMKFLLIIDGACPSGADHLAALWAHQRRAAGDPVDREGHPANWNLYGKQAGPLRNSAMVSLGADECWAFFQPGADNVGTGDCAGKARLAGIPLRRFPPDEQQPLF